MNFESETGITMRDFVDEEDDMEHIPNVEDRGKFHYGKCTCGGTITAIRSTYNGHLHAECSDCGFKLHE